MKILRSKWKIAGFLLVTAVLSAYVVFAAPLPFVHDIWMARSEAWSDPYKVRHRMTDAMLMTDYLVGMPESDVVELLGAPLDREFFGRAGFVYVLGQERGFLAVDSELLFLRFSPKGKVSEAKLVRD